MLAWTFRAWLLVVQHCNLVSLAKQAVATDNKNWDLRLERRLESAVANHDSREAWAVSRQLAGHGPSRILAHAAPAAKVTTSHQWKEHMRAIWGAKESCCALGWQA